MQKAVKGRIKEKRESIKRKKSITDKYEQKKENEENNRKKKFKKSKYINESKKHNKQIIENKI